MVTSVHRPPLVQVFRLVLTFGQVLDFVGFVCYPGDCGEPKMLVHSPLSPDGKPVSVLSLPSSLDFVFVAYSQFSYYHGEISEEVS